MFLNVTILRLSPSTHNYVDVCHTNIHAYLYVDVYHSNIQTDLASKDNLNPVRQSGHRDIFLLILSFIYEHTKEENPVHAEYLSLYIFMCLIKPVYHLILCLPSHFKEPPAEW